jgi:hypothetical protein
LWFGITGRAATFPRQDHEHQVIAVRATLFLDTAAFVIENVDDLLGILNRFDIAATHAPGQSNTRIPKSEAFLPFDQRDCTA